MCAGESSEGRTVRVDFQCKRCGYRHERVVPSGQWQATCPECEGPMRRLIAVQLQFPVALKEENIDTFRAMNAAIEPSEDTIRAVHRFNYGEEPDKKTVKEVQEKRLVVW